MARTDKDGCVQKVTDPKRLGLNQIQRKFATVVRERKADTKTASDEFMASTSSRGLDQTAIFKQLQQKLFANIEIINSRME